MHDQTLSKISSLIEEITKIIEKDKNDISQLDRTILIVRCATIISLLA